MKLAISALVVAALAAGSAAATDARACGFFDYREVRPVVKARPVFVAANDRIAAADQRLEEAKNEAAGLEVVTAFPQIRGVAVGASPLETRALRILSLAVVRGEGTLAGVRGFTGTTAAQRTASFEWAVQTLRAVDAQKHDDPVAKADLAEALARSPQGQDEALSILSDLTARDLVGSAHAYAALARLRSARGDASGVRAALARCETMTRSASTVCRAPDGRVAMRD